MKYLLDTDICIYLIKQRPQNVIDKLSSLPNSEVALSAITVFELQYGVECSHARKRSQQALNHFMEPVLHILEIDQQVAIQAAKVRAQLRQKGTPIGPYDLLIAAAALTHGLTLVSNNEREFQRVEGLALENWATG
jgi:tRNA(fMet)-specific endonuclease VapC